MMKEQSNPLVYEHLKKYYQSSTNYRDDLITHDEHFLMPFLHLIERYVPKQTRILDIGCGTGLSTRLLSAEGYHATGLDLSPLFLSVEKKNSPETELLAGNALQLPFADETFDAVTGFEFVEHVHDVPAMLDEIVRVLKVRGHLVLHSPNLLSPYLPAFDILRMMLGGKGRPVFAETLPQAYAWLKQNLALSLQKKFSLRPHFLYRNPDLSEQHIGGDADSVFLANPMDLARYLKSIGCAVDQRAHAMSLKNKFIAAMTPNFAPYMGIVAHKLSTAKTTKK